MTSITKEIMVAAATADVWDALADFGALHHRVVPGFVVECKLDGNDREVTFASGAVATERLVTLDHDRRRIVYAVVESQLDFSHHQASVDVVEGAGGEGCSIVWTSDFLPGAPRPIVDALMTQGAEVMRQNFSGVAANL
jgi:hypothetical protein